MIESPHSEPKKRFLKPKLPCKFFILLVKSNLFLAVIDEVLAHIHNHIEILPEMKVVLQGRKHLFLLWIHAILGGEEIDELGVIVIRIILISVTRSSNSNVLFNAEGFVLFNKLLKKRSKISYLLIDEKFEVV
jgi:hypothetical protein